MSTESRCLVVSLPAPMPHPNADALDIINVYGDAQGGGYPCIVKRGSFQAGDLAVYVPIDSLVPIDRPDFTFLAPKANADGRARIQAVRLRGVFSMGLLVPAPEGARPGDDVTEALGVDKYEAPEPTAGTKRDPGFLPVYDVEGVRRWGHVLELGEEVIIEEKIDGQNARFAFHDGRFWCASRTNYWEPMGDSPWARVARRYGLAERLRWHGDLGFYGEILPDGSLTVFDVFWHNAKGFLSWSSRNNMVDNLNDAGAHLPIYTPPVLYKGPWQGLDAHVHLAEGQTLRYGGTGLREGWVVRPVRERHHPELGRVLLKLHGQGWLLRGKK